MALFAAQYRDFPSR